ncbi:ribbon-helix-helix protein, CopG family [Mobiluncus mulieris]|uniref:plasmid mobilization protein n=1 Tax=Mobiluncus mulieris TaxID=2052 RepID=UPI0014702B4D|nr:ribbon-helix-helix protein, CopG family [Mobiluncus mulieris]
MEEAINGVLVTEAQIEQWAAEAEAGYDVAAMKKHGRGRPGRGEAPSRVVAVRFTPEELAKLDARAAARQVTRSALIREAALA